MVVVYPHVGNPQLAAIVPARSKLRKGWRFAPELTSDILGSLGVRIVHASEALTNGEN